MPILVDGLLAALACVAYGLAWSLSWRGVSRRARTQGGAMALPLPGQGDSVVDAARWPLLAALAFHGLALALPVLDAPVRFGFAQALSTALWLGACLLWAEGFSVRVDALRLLVLPAAALAAWLPAFFPGVDVSAVSDRPFFLPHLVIAMLAYSVMTVAALHAVLMAVAERALHASGRRASTPAGLQRWIESLPPLLTLERLLFRFIAIGFALLTLTVITGVVFAEEVFGRALRWDHKTVFSLLAWGLFGVLLAGRVLRGWRGRTALRLALGGFALLLMAYAGSRFVLEVVLERGV